MRLATVLISLCVFASTVISFLACDNSLKHSGGIYNVFCLLLSCQFPYCFYLI